MPTRFDHPFQCAHTIEMIGFDLERGPLFPLTRWKPAQWVVRIHLQP
jgi:hypothetical protein